MHHCVYTNGYYKKPDSLILSARDRITDHRIETIEVNLKTLSVEQSRGVCNENTIHHGRIIELVNNNIHLDFCSNLSFENIPQELEDDDYKLNLALDIIKEYKLNFEEILAIQQVE